MISFPSLTRVWVWGSRAWGAAGIGDLFHTDDDVHGLDCSRRTRRSTNPDRRRSAPWTAGLGPDRSAPSQVGEGVRDAIGDHDVDPGADHGVDLVGAVHRPGDDGQAEAVGLLDEARLPPASDGDAAPRNRGRRRCRAPPTASRAGCTRSPRATSLAVPARPRRGCRARTRTRRPGRATARRGRRPRPRQRGDIGRHRFGRVVAGVGGDVLDLDVDDRTRHMPPGRASRVGTHSGSSTRRHSWMSPVPGTSAS